MFATRDLVLSRLGDRTLHQLERTAQQHLAYYYRFDVAASPAPSFLHGNRLGREWTRKEWEQWLTLLHAELAARARSSRA